MTDGSTSADAPQPTPDDYDGPIAGPDIDFSDPNSPLAKYYLQISHVFATLFVVLVFFFFNLMAPLWHSDVWAHLKVGERIVADRALPTRELFSPFSDQTQPNNNFQWLAQVIMIGVYRAGEWLAGGDALTRTEGGVEFLRALHALLQAAKAAFLILAFRRATGSLPAAVAGAALVFAFSLAPSAIQRPQAFAEALFAAALWVLLAPKFHWRHVVAYAVLMTLWANLHGSFLVGLALGGVVGFGRTIDVIRDGGWTAPLRSGDLGRMLTAGLAAVVLASTLHPHGLRAIPDVLEFAKNPNVRTMQEWRPLDFSGGAGGHWGYLALLAIVLLAQTFSASLPTPTALAMLASFGFFPLLQERLMTWWVMLVPLVVLPLALDALAPLASRMPAPSLLSLRKTILCGGLVAVGAVWSSFAQLLLGHAPLPIEKSVSQATFWQITPELLAGEKHPPEIQKRLDANPLHKNLAAALSKYPGGRFRGTIFTAEALGDYLVWALPPKAPVMAYSHVHVFPVDYWEDYMEVLFAKPGWRFVLDRHDINLVMVQAEQRQDLVERLREDPDWEVVIDESERPINRWYRIFAAIRKKPLGGEGATK